LIDSHFDIPASPVIKTIYSEQSTQTEDAPSEDDTTQTGVSDPVTQGTQTDSEPPLSLSSSDIKSQQTEPIESAKADNGTSLTFSTSEIRAQQTEPVESTKADNEPSITFSTSEITSQQTEPVEFSEAEVDDEIQEEEENTSIDSQPPSIQSPCCEKEHLCTACGEKFDYSSEDDEVESKTPWQELCDGLVAFAGMQRE
jgi:hypothetical protein